MSATSINTEKALLAHRANPEEASSGATADKPQPSPNRNVARDRWRRHSLEIVAFLTGIALLRHYADFPDTQVLPHPYALPVLLASCQYGLSGGVFAAIVASLLYVLDFSPQSGAQDLYAYARAMVIQPAFWVATALIAGGLRSLHIHQHAELSEAYAASRRQAADLNDGLGRAAAEIQALERRIATDSSSVAALSRSLAQIDLTDRRTVAASLGRVFQVATGVRNLAFYWRSGREYVPAWASENDAPRPVSSMKSLPADVVDSLADDLDAAPRSRRRVVVLHGCELAREPFAAIVCDHQTCRDPAQFERRAGDMARVLAMLSAAAGFTSSGARP